MRHRIFRMLNALPMTPLRASVLRCTDARPTRQVFSALRRPQRFERLSIKQNAVFTGSRDHQVRPHASV